VDLRRAFAEQEALRAELRDVRRYVMNVARTALESDSAEDYQRAMETILTSGKLAQVLGGER